MPNEAGKRHSTAKSYKVRDVYNGDVAMRNTKVYSITMPPELARQAERLAKEESRTMSELMREAFRRYQIDKAERQLLSDPLRAKHLAELKQVLGELRQEAKEKGLSKMTLREIDAEVEAARKDRANRREPKAQPNDSGRF
jgi:predicted DNA-binding protein